MAIWLPILLWAIGKLIDWLISNRELTIDQRERIDKVIYRMNMARSLAVDRGCNVEGTP